MGERYLHHITLTTGHVRRSPRSEVRDDVIALLRPDIARAVAGERVAIPGQHGYYMTAAREGRCLVVTASSALGPLVTVGIAPHSRCGSALWRRLHERDWPTPLATRGDPCPPEPWCAVVILPALALDRRAQHWLGDWERCLAWAWIERESRYMSPGI